MVIKVGIADLNVGKAPQKLVTIGLGSCIGVTIYDPISKVGGMAHVMLPDSTTVKNNDNIAKFADTGVRDLYTKVQRKGGDPANFVAKMAGGAQMFRFSNQSDSVRVGDKNILAVKKALRELGVPVRASDVGDSYGRTVEFDLETGILLVKTIGKGEKEI